MTLSDLLSLLTDRRVSSATWATWNFLPDAKMLAARSTQQFCSPVAAAAWPMLTRALHSSAQGSDARALSATRTEPASPHRTTPSNTPLDVLFDGECPLCMHEISWLRRRNQKRGGVAPITFTDISLPTYNPAAHAGVSYEAAMKSMHVIKAGSVVSGVEAFRHIYEAAGLGFVVKALESKTVLGFAKRLYGVWAGLRLPMSGRPSLQVLLERRAAHDATCARKGGRKGEADGCR